MRFQFKREWMIPIGVGIVSFVSGAASGYFVNERRRRVSEIDQEIKHVQLTFEFDDQLRQFNRAMAQVNHIINKFNERGSVFLADEEAAKIVPGLIESKEGHPSNDRGGKIVVDEEVLAQSRNVVNIFPADDDDDDWDYDIEVPLRTPDKPYIIHRDEYFDQERDCSQSSLMFYAGDHILCDDHDTPVYDPEKVVGIIRFGHGSKDPNVCYVRNETLDAEYEILQDPGYYQIEVLGEALAEKDLKHSKVIQKFRME